MKGILRILIILFAWLAGGYILNQYEYFTAFPEIDNTTGMLPFAIALIVATGTTIFLLKKRTKRFLPVSVLIVVFVVLSIVLFPLAIRGNWWITAIQPNEAEVLPDLSEYAPFSSSTKIAKLDDPPNVQFVDDLPVLDGATALYPVYAAFAEAVYDAAAYSHDKVLCTNTSGAYKAILSGERDIIFVAGASEGQIAAAKANGADLRFIPIGHEAFVFLVGNLNPIDSLSDQQIRNIYSGKTAYWRTLGWDEGGRIIAFQRPEGSGSQTGLQTIMQGVPIQVPQPLPDAGLIGTNSLMKQVSVEWQGVQPAIGYSYRYYATTMFANPEAKVLKVNGVNPSIENIQNGSYPFTGDFYAVTNGEPEGNVKALIDWILSEQGQEIIGKTGYVPLL